MSTPARCQRGTRPLASDELVLHIELSVRPHPMVELTAARLLMVTLEELQRDHVLVHRLEVGLQGRLVAPREEAR